ncbi:unnamed protein product [Cunninghamella blakesleeana]
MIPNTSFNQDTLNVTLKRILVNLSKYPAISLTSIDLFQEMNNKLLTKQYHSLKDFKLDIDKLFTILRSKCTISTQQDIDFLYTTVLSSISVEMRYIMFKDNEKETIESILKPDKNIQQRTALFRPSLDGFAFTDANKNNIKSNENLPSQLQAITIHPINSNDTYHVPSMKHSIQPPFRFPPKFRKHEDKPIIPTQWLDYGTFTSFAPACDSNNANTSYEATYMGRAAKRFRRWERRQRKSHFIEKMNQDDEIDINWLKENGLDEKAIVNAMSIGHQDNSTSKNILPDELLLRNEKLIESLLKYQEYRFVLNDTTINEKEQQTAELLQRQLYDMLLQLPPKDIIQQEDIDSAMGRTPVLLDTAYRGVLSTFKPFAYPTNEKLDPLPPFANMTPTYSKDRWRLIDLTGHPSLSASSTSVDPNYNISNTANNGTSSIEINN